MRHPDRYDPPLADSSRARRPEVSTRLHGDEGPHEGWPASDDHQSRSESETLASGGNRQCSLPERPTEKGVSLDWADTHVDCVDAIRKRNSSLGERKAWLRADEPLVDASSHGRREGRATPTLGSRWKTAPIAGMVMGDTNGSRLEDRQCGPEPGPHPSTWPPGPADGAGWGEVLDVRPDLAPAIERGVLRMADGMANRVDRLRGVGNGVVPLVAAYAFCTLATRAGLHVALSSLMNVR